MTHRAYNFRKPDRLAGTLEHRLTAWLRSASQLAADRAAQLLPFRIEMALQGIAQAPPLEVLSALPETVLGYRIASAGSSADMLFLWPRPLALALVNAALGETPTELPADRELTAVELSLCEYLMQALGAAVLQETWRGGKPLLLTVQEREPSPRWTRLFVKAEQLLQCTFTLRGPFGDQEWYWLAPYQALHELLAHAETIDSSLFQQESTRKLEALVRELPIEMTVELGSIDLPIAQLAALAPGDLLILKQRVSEPLNVRVDNHPKFRGWPGRVGVRQSLQIESLRE
ncbi:MAG TPA: FliM/FliN family flagellar motor switch protein [Gemmataceae bacterium]|nr:FliM/FliN family flagellar motor switch protein [Gemmataceae bacterium]